MLKLVVFCIVVVTVVAKPAALLAAHLVAPYTYSSVVAPSTTTITKQESSIVHLLPHYYSAPLVYNHYIKKRSILLGLPIYCAPSTYIASPLLPPISFPYSILQTYLVPATFAAPFNHILKKPVLTYTGESTIPLNVETHKNDVFNNVPKNDATINPSTEAPKYENMSTNIFNKDSTNKEPIQRDSYGKPLMNIPAVTASNTQKCTYDLKALFENGSLICKDPQNSKDVK